MPRKIDLTNIRFGSWVAAWPAGRRQRKSGCTQYGWLCFCDCGNFKVVDTSTLRAGLSKSCGMGKCARKFKHGMCESSEYRSWDHMIQRCTNPNKNQYHDYGGRGISVCNRWMVFQNFLDDMGPKSPEMTLDRINVYGNYEPSNCRWASSKDQQKNKRKQLAIENFSIVEVFNELCRKAATGGVVHA